MRIQQKSGSDVRKILIGMITSDQVVLRLASIWKAPGLFKDRWSNLIGSWCVRYFERYSKAPRGDIESRFQQWAKHNDDKSSVKMIERFLSVLDGEFSDEVNAEYLIDLAGEHFESVALENLSESISAAIESRDLEGARKAQSAFRHVEVGAAAPINVFSDKTAGQLAFESTADNIIRYPGALGNFFEGILDRDNLVSLMAPEKRGKTFWLIDIAMRSAMQRNKTVFFGAGDMSQNQMLKRFYRYAAKRPLRPKANVSIPTCIQREPESDIAEIVKTVTKSWDKRMTWKEGARALHKLQENKIKSRDPYLMLSCHPNDTLSVDGIRSLLQAWNYVPDVIVIDYADILATPSGYKESRDAINATWKQLRRLSQEMHCLVVTATQADAASYKQKSLGMSNFTDDKRKMAHVTAMIGINQDSVEREMGLQRLGFVVARELDFSIESQVHVGGNLDVGRVAICSTF